MAKITLEQLRANNRGYAFGADALNQNDLDIVNNLIERIESTRSNAPNTLDRIIYTDKYGGYYPNAMLESDTYFDNLPCIVQHASAHVWIREDKTTVGLSSSGGSYDGHKDISKFEYIGTSEKTFWTWSSAGAGASHGLYFQAEVSLFRYNERADDLKHLTSEFLTLIYVYEHANKPDEYGYKYTAHKGACSYKAWHTKEELDKFLTAHKAIEEKTPNLGQHKYWIESASI